MRVVAGAVMVIACVGSGPIGWAIGLAGEVLMLGNFIKKGKMLILQKGYNI